MLTAAEPTDKELIEENAHYVLGMYDMYPNDGEIVDMLRMKGLNDSIVQQVLFLVKKPAYEKRVKQAKVMIGIGATLLVVFVLLPYLVIHFSGSATPQDDLVANGQPYTVHEYKGAAGAFIGVFKFLIRIVFYVVILGISQLALGTYSLFKYKKLLRSV